MRSRVNVRVYSHRNNDVTGKVWCCRTSTHNKSTDQAMEDASFNDMGEEDDFDAEEDEI